MKKLGKVRSRWVVKVGSNIVCTGGPLLVRSWMHQVSELRKKQGIEIIWVSSGAIAMGVERTGFESSKRTLIDKQALSAIGQPLLMDLYEIALQSYGFLGAQVLLTSDDLKNRERRSNVHGTLTKLLSWNILPIINENDTTATEEIRFGDNDALSAHVASLMEADRLVILTDVEGLYDADPRQFPKAKLIHRVERLTPKIQNLATGGGSTRGTGGMASKMKAAVLAGRHGIPTHLVKGDSPAALLRIAKGELIGTSLEANPKKTSGGLYVPSTK